MKPLRNEKYAAKMIGKSVSWLQKDRSTTRSVPFVKISGSVRYIEDDLEAFIMKNRIPSSQEGGASR